MRSIDVCLVAGRRPELLRATLESFERGLFRNFRICRFIVNIDPIFGSDEDLRNCISVIRDLANDALITTPETSGFAAAVIRNWGMTTSDVIFHLEDDWLLHRAITSEDIAPFDNDPSLGQISLNAKEKNWDTRLKGDVAYRRRHFRLFGIPTPFRRKMPIFSTSPSFLRGSFARTAAGLMDPTFDPEKQFYRQVNAPLEAFVASYKNKVLGNGPDFPAIDIGRDWRDQRNIEKLVVDSKSVWSTKG